MVRWSVLQMSQCESTYCVKIFLRCASVNVSHSFSNRSCWSFSFDSISITIFVEICYSLRCQLVMNNKSPKAWTHLVIWFILFVLLKTLGSLTTILTYLDYVRPCYVYGRLFCWWIFDSKFGKCTMHLRGATNGPGERKFVHLKREWLHRFLYCPNTFNFCFDEITVWHTSQINLFGCISLSIRSDDITRIFSSADLEAFLVILMLSLNGSSLEIISVGFTSTSTRSIFVKFESLNGSKLSALHMKSLSWSLSDCSWIAMKLLSCSCFTKSLKYFVCAACTSWWNVWKLSIFVQQSMHTYFGRGSNSLTYS